MRSSLTTPGGLAGHAADLADLAANSSLVDQIRETGLATFEGLSGRGTVLAAVSRIMTITPHRDSDPDGLTTIRDTGRHQRAGGAGFGSGELRAHTDSASSPRPPRLLLLACQQPAAAGGESLLADGQAVLAELAAQWPEAAMMLSRPRTVFFGAVDGSVTQVFTIHNGGRFAIRLRQDELARWSPLVARYIPCLADVITRHQIRFRLTAGQGYLLDNHRWLHARTGFSGDRQFLRAHGEPRFPLPASLAANAARILPPTFDETT